MAKTQQNASQPSESIEHLALLYGNSDVVSGLMAGLQYEGLAVIGAIPIDHNAGPPKNNHETEDYLLGVITEMVTQPNSNISNIPIIRNNLITQFRLKVETLKHVSRFDY